ncbi:MAG TPA: hypothetical protein VFW94_23740 [Candidatus Acidoferrales bacterium]|nr:hypothetical protein [Candidatus Acidoferrales bacterium]
MAKDEMLPTGEAGSGLIRGAGRGEFNCGNCIHFRRGHAKNGICEHPVVDALSQEPRMGGYVKVDEDDCCSYQRRPGDK